MNPNGDHAGKVFDADGLIVPDIAADAFADLRVRRLAGGVRDAADSLGKLLATAEEFGDSLADVFPWVRWVDVVASLRLAAEEAGEAAKMLANGLPYRLCRRCGGRGCPDCKGGGHLPRG